MWFPNPDLFPLAPNEARVAVFRANNARQAADLATQFLRSIDLSPESILDFQMTAGGGGNVDLTVIFAPLDPGVNLRSDLCRFVGVEAVDAVGFGLEANRILDGSQAFPPFSFVGGVSVATGATAGKVCAALLLVRNQGLGSVTGTATRAHAVGPEPLTPTPGPAAKPPKRGG